MEEALVIGFACKNSLEFLSAIAYTAKKWECILAAFLGAFLKNFKIMLYAVETEKS